MLASDRAIRSDLAPQGVRPSKPYEFGVKVSVATTLRHSKGGQFVTHAQALPGNPYDGHTLATVIPDMEALIGNTIKRAFTDKGYRGTMPRPITGSGSSSPGRSGA